MTRLSVALLALVVTLAACAAGTRGSPPASVASASPSATPTEAGTPTATATLEPSATAAPTDASTADFAWTEAAMFDASDDGYVMVTDISAWSGGFVGIGEAWGPTGEQQAPVVWTSQDGRAWTDANGDLGTGRIALRGILRPASGGVVIVGESVDQDGVTARARAWRSDDGRAWEEMDLPGEIAGQGPFRVASGPIGHLIGTQRKLWYSADGESWRHVHETPEGIGLLAPVAGDEGFVAPATASEGGSPVIYASGDGLSWFEGSPPVDVFGVVAWRGDWIGSGFTNEPPTISLFRSENGLDWSVTHDVNELTPPNGPKAGLGMDSGITGVQLAAEGGVVVLTLAWSHCCVTPSRGVGTFVSIDGETWASSRLPETAYVGAVATDGEVMVIGGSLQSGERAAFWVADR